jgi:UDP-N-acetylmuramoyl-L-alanyl-D-glutamate--2,6-diaminopimelate ligase
MTLREALKDIDLTAAAGNLDATQISSLAYDSRAVTAGTLFIALRGEKTDGHRYLEQARLAGAAALLVEAGAAPSGSWQIPVIQVSDTRRAMARVAANFYGHPSLQLKTLAVTGTNGKSTTAWLMHHLCETALFRSGFIGTFGYYIGGEARPAERTTPESPELQRMLREILDAGGRAVAFEASSHAIVQARVAAVELNVLVFTNLTQDHLDYHGTMEEYYKAKAAGFHQMAAQKTKRGTAVINIDDFYGRRLAKELKDAYPDETLRVLTYGIGGNADFQALDFQSSRQGQQFALKALGRSYLVRTPLLGRFNLYNTLAALTAIQCLGIDIRTAIKALPDVPQVPGRMQLVPLQAPFTVFVDYAHTDDALANVLKAARELPHRHIRVVFGCGGDRDRAKRPKMAAAAELGAEYVYVTSDNPRTEDPAAILADIVKGLKKPPRLVEVDRRAAIHKAIQEAKDGDIVVIAGKGHENYQELATGKIDFDDVKVAQEALRGVHDAIQLEKQRQRSVAAAQAFEERERIRLAREEAMKPRKTAQEVAAAKAASLGPDLPNQEKRELSAKDIARRRLAAKWMEENGLALDSALTPEQVEAKSRAMEEAVPTEADEVAAQAENEAVSETVKGEGGAA